jgi:hypothetical protein
MRWAAASAACWLRLAATLGRPKMTRAWACGKGEGAGQLGQAEREKGNQDNFPFFFFLQSYFETIAKRF